MPKTKNNAQKNVSINRGVIEQVNHCLYDAQTKHYKDFSSAVEEGLKIWLQRDAMADDLQSIITAVQQVSACVGLHDCDFDNIDDATKHARRLLEIVLGTGTFKLEVPTPRSTVEEALKFWEHRFEIAEHMSTIANVLSDIDGMPDDAIKDAGKAVDAIVNLLPPETPQAAPKPPLPADVVTNLRDGIDRPAKEPKEDASK